MKQWTKLKLTCRPQKWSVYGYFWLHGTANSRSFGTVRNEKAESQYLTSKNWDLCTKQCFSALSSMCQFWHITQKVSGPRQPTDDQTAWPKSPWVVLSTHKERRKSIEPKNFTKTNLRQTRRLIVAALQSGWDSCFENSLSVIPTATAQSYYNYCKTQN